MLIVEFVMGILSL